VVSPGRPIENDAERRRDGIRRLDPRGIVRVATGVGPQGQGHYTVVAQIVANALGVAVEDVQVTTEDTRESQWGTGTFAARRGHCRKRMPCRSDVRTRQNPRARESAVGSGTGRSGAWRRPRRCSRSDRTITLAELAVQANPLRGAVRPGSEPGLESTAYFGPDHGSTGSGVHPMIVEVDPETATVDIKRYVVVHACGRIINPMLVEGQIHGGVAQGIGNAFYEQLVYDEQGQLLNASFMDYLLPTATDVPRIETAHRETPSPFKPIGLKGVGQAGCIPTGAVFAQAVEDAVNVEVLEIPLSPDKLFDLIADRP
jgi:CO/xanthine dehydrogenase Mo-binding subunit